MDINDNPSSCNDFGTANLKDINAQDNTALTNISHIKENIPNGTENENNKSLDNNKENGFHESFNEDMNQCVNANEPSCRNDIIDSDCLENNSVICKNSVFSSSFIEGFKNLKIVDESLNISATNLKIVDGSLNISATDSNLSTIAEYDEKSVEFLTESKSESFLDKLENGDKSTSPEQDSKTTTIAANGDASNSYTDEKYENILDSSFGKSSINSVEPFLPLDSTDEASGASVLDITVIENMEALDKSEASSMEPILNESAEIKSDDNILIATRNSDEFPSISENSVEFKIPGIPFKSNDSLKTVRVTSDSIETTPELSKPSEDRIEEDEFQDAATFFKDPSSFQYLENLSSSNHSEFIQRSSLYVKFDPLHSVTAQQPDTLQMLSKSMVTPTSSHEAVVEVDNITNKSCNFSPPAHLKEQSGNTLISFDSPLKKVIEKPQPPVPVKMFTEEEMQRILKNQELVSQDTYLKQSREIAEMLKKQQDANFEMEKLKQEWTAQKEEISELNALLASQDVKLVNVNGMCTSLHTTLEEFSAATSTKIQSLLEEMKCMEETNKKLQDDYSTSVQDLQSMENTFADFHKRYEQCKTMLKTYKENEDSWKQQVENLKSQVGEQDQKYLLLQSRTEEMLQTAESDSNAARKSSEAQIAVLTAQLKKSELKISSLESDLKQVKIENSKLGSICDELMAKVGTA